MSISPVTSGPTPAAPTTQAPPPPPPQGAIDKDGDRDGTGSPASAGLLNIKA
jgi:hypothetical protein